MLKKNKITINGLDDINVEYSETCDIDHIYIVTLKDVEHMATEYSVSVRYESTVKEAEVLILNDDIDTYIGLIKVKKNMKNDIKLIVLSYLIGDGKARITTV